MSDARRTRRIDTIDVSTVATALDDAGTSMSWWYDPNTGTVAIGEYGGEPVDDDDHGYAAIEAVGSHEAYEDMVDFADVQADRRLAAELQRALQGSGAFRRFRDVLYEHEEVSRLWRTFSEARSEIRAIRWLYDGGFIDTNDAERATDVRRQVTLEALVAAGQRHGIEIESSAISAQWIDVVAAIDDDRTVTILRDGEPWATVSPTPADNRR